MDCLFSELTTLQYQNKAMRQELEAFRNGERYKKLQANHHKVVTGYIKEISRLLAKAHADTARVRNIWFEECDSDWEKYQKFLCMGRRLFAAHYEQFKREGAAWCEDKMKVPGQFASAGTADNYAAIRTYIETCRRNGINEMEALKRLCRGCPYTVEEIFPQASQP